MISGSSPRCYISPPFEGLEPSVSRLNSYKGTFSRLVGQGSAIKRIEVQIQFDYSFTIFEGPLSTGRF